MSTLYHYYINIFWVVLGENMNVKIDLGNNTDYKFQRGARM